MFSDIVVEHPLLYHSSSHQTVEGPSQPPSPSRLGEEGTPSTSLLRKASSLSSSPRRPTTATTLTAPTAAAGLTCQELLALSGALGAALPTPSALPVATGEDASSAAAAAATKYVHHHHRNNNNNQLALRAAAAAASSNSSILPTLAMALWPEPYGKSYPQF